MSNHPNRSKDPNAPGRTPKPEEIKALREALGLTTREAANLIYATATAWSAWEAGEKMMHAGLWELFKIKVRSAPAD
jgi:putative transcriptional regulator